MRLPVLPALAFLAALTAPRCLVAQGAPDKPADPYIWLEDAHGDKPMAWVRAENAKTVNVLERDPRYAGNYREAMRIGEAKDRIPYVTFIGGALYNFWQDSAHVRGIWRRT